MPRRRGSRGKLVLLDDKVKLDVPLDELAVHEPDARKLIAFLKAMEFSTLTRRVAEYSQIDPADVEADDKQQERRQPALLQLRRLRRKARSAARTARSGGDLFALASRPSPQAGEQAHAASPATGRTRRPASRARRSRSPPRAPRPRAKLPVDRNKYQTIRSLDELNAWIARVHDTGHVAIEAKANSIDPMQAEMCGIALALAPNDACYIPLGHKQSGDGAGLFAAGLAPDQIKAADALDGAAAAAGIGRAS